MKLSEELRKAAQNVYSVTDLQISGWYTQVVGLEMQNERLHLASRRFAEIECENVRLKLELQRLRAELTPPAHEDSPLQRAFEIPSDEHG